MAARRASGPGPHTAAGDHFRPGAGRAPRDYVLPADEQIADLLPRPVRIDLHRWCTEGTAEVSVLQLPDARPRGATAARHVDARWTATSPLLRAAGAALAHLESTGIRLAG